MSYTGSILITGGTSGLGYETALALAAQHPTILVVVASRSDPHACVQTINSTLRQSNVIFLPLDLSSTPSVRSFVLSWSAASYPPIHYLLLNAGIQFPTGYVTTDDGVEKTFATNHLGHALLFFLLRPHLAPRARIVLTSSGTHDPAQKTGVVDAVYTSAEELAYPSEASKKKDPGLQRYSTSKLCNVLFTYALARRLENEGQGRTVVAFDPGLMPSTGLTREAGRVVRFVFDQVIPRTMGLLRAVVSPNIHTAKESAANLVAITIVKEGGEGKNGVYFEGAKQIKSSVVSYETVKQEDLWGWTVRHLSVNEDERRRFE
ncbi:hypothetical protein DL95DRAFT_399106, partial [Leptodontidium sp. 2 PMI_412]